MPRRVSAETVSHAQGFMPPICFIIGHMAIESVPACMCSIMWLI
jgi:hypothetical protein